MTKPKQKPLRPPRAATPIGAAPWRPGGAPPDEPLAPDAVQPALPTAQCEDCDWTNTSKAAAALAARHRKSKGHTVTVTKPSR